MFMDYTWHYGTPFSNQRFLRSENALLMASLRRSSFLLGLGLLLTLSIENKDKNFTFI